MKIAYLVPGSGGTFYCGNCLRDKFFTTALRESGNDIVMIPMYLPLNLGQCEADSPIFYGALTIYLEQLSPVFRHLPSRVKRFLDSEKVLRFVGKLSASTSASGHEAMTISMLKGSHGKQADELEVLVNWLKNHEKPDVVHLSNALLSGLAPRLKKDVGCAVVCTLQDEDEWVDEMREPFATQTWNLIEENARYIDAFISSSNYYAQFFQSKISIHPDKMYMIYNSVASVSVRKKDIPPAQPTIGYMSKISSHFGADMLFDAFLELKKEPAFKQLRLIYTGGYTDDYKVIVSHIRRKTKQLGCENDVVFHEDLSIEGKKQFLNSINVFCVPSRRKEAFGMHMLEAIAAEVPVVMPDHGAYTEVLMHTEAGLLYEPGSLRALTDALRRMFTDKELYLSLQQNCHPGIFQRFEMAEQTQKNISVYSRLI